MDWLPEGLNQGDDIAGIVHEVGANIKEFKVRQIISIPKNIPPPNLLGDSPVIGSAHSMRCLRSMVVMPNMRSPGAIARSICQRRFHLKVIIIQYTCICQI